MKSRPKGPLTDGARKVLALLAAQGISIPSFCRTHDLPRIVVQRALNGQRKRFTVDFACSVEDATGGAVSCADWKSSTLADASGPRSITDKKTKGQPARDRKRRSSPTEETPASSRGPGPKKEAIPAKAPRTAGRKAA